MPETIVQLERITKRFAGVTALDGVSLSILPGECHGLVGENGAGKSTLGKLLAGIHRPDSGRLIIDGAPRHFASPRDALRAGVGMVHQELAFCPDLTVVENLCMGQYPRRLGFLIDRDEMRARAEALLSRIGVALDVHKPMRSLSTAQEQMVQIASAVGTAARILVFDEPTSSLSEPESQQLFELIAQLKIRGVTMIYVSHRMPELMRLCDRISVLRDGRHVGTIDRASASPDQIVKMMIGRSLAEYFPQHLAGARGDVMLRARNLSSPGKFADVSFDVRAGEIVGFAGLVGAGRSEVARAIFGLDPAATGSIEIDGHHLKHGSIRSAKRWGIGLVPEDRKRQGLVLMLGGRQNFSLAMLDRLSRLGLLQQRAERRRTIEYFDRFDVRTPSIDTPVAALSGGNQQKIALAKWLARGAKLLIVDEPTRGVDIAAKAAIHAVLDDLARQGVAIMLISSELPEVLNLSTRIIVMRAGRIVADVPREHATQEKILRLMAGVTPSESRADAEKPDAPP